MRITLLAAAFLFTTAFSPSAGAGPLDPPSGPIASTAKPLAEVEPRIAINAANTPGNANAQFIINAGGSYYLTANIAGDTRTCILVNAANVTIDLNGCTIDGKSLSGAGISAAGDFITIRNGKVINCVSSGVLMTGNHDAASDLAVHGGGKGIVLGGYFLVDRCQVSGCTTSMIEAQSGGVIRGCDLGGGPVGITCGNSNTILDCTVTETTSKGINTGASCQIARCLVTSASGTGIGVTTQCVVDSCDVSMTTGDGILSTGSGTVRENTVNSATSGSGSGVRVTGADVRIERNNVVRFAKAIDVAATGSLVIGNSVTGASTAYTIVAGNRYGPIVDISAASGGAVSGSTAASNLTTTDPTANYAY